MNQSYRHSHELKSLLSKLVDQHLDQDEGDRLAALLREDASARAYYLKFMALEAGLNWEGAALLAPIEQAPEAVAYPAERVPLHEDVQRSQKRPQHQQLATAAMCCQRAMTEPPAKLWFNWHQLATVGLAIVLFGAGLAFGYSVPKAVRYPLELANAGFEDQGAPPLTAAPLGYRLWSGDGEAVLTCDGVAPEEGRKMGRFVSSEAAAQGAERLRASVSQVVDVRSWRAVLREGMAIVDCSASFNGAADSDPVQTTYRIDVRAYSGDESVLQKPLPERADQELAHSVWRTSADHDPSIWQSVTGSLILPPETEYLLIQLKVFRPIRSGAPRPEASFHYVDDVRLSLVTSSSLNPVPHAPPTS